MSVREFWGLDFETSGTDPDVHVPIQIGIAAPNGALFTSDIGGWRWGESAVWDYEAQKVHDRSPYQFATAPTPAQVTAEAVKFIEEHSEAWLGERKLVGWNVASFDAAFLRKYLPGIARVLSYQSADLNAICFAISQAHGISYKNIKEESKWYAESMLQGGYALPQWHDAGYDAIAARYSFEYLTDRIKEGY